MYNYICTLSNVKKVLIITYYWPPSGGSGVQRWLKYVKYLRDFDIEPIVLTVHSKDAIYPNKDNSLLKDIPNDLKVYYARAKSPLNLYQKIRRKPVPKSGFAGESKTNFIDSLFRFIRGNFYIPDARKGWNNYAFKAAKKIIQENDISTIITSSPPHSTQLIGYRLKNELRLNWIADLRDPWTDLFYNKNLFQTSIAQKIDKYLEKKCLLNADKLIVVSEHISRQLIKKYPVIKPKMNIIPNGFDPADFNNIDAPSSELKSISYIGSLSESYPIERFISAFKLLCKSSPEWQLKYVGNISESTKDLITKNQLEGNTEFIPYTPHNEAIKYMLNSDLLLLIIPKTEGNKGILTGKLFEYIASRRPILFIGPIDGDAALILSEFENVVLLDYTDDIDLNEITRKLVKQKSNSNMINKYSRISQTERIAKLIDFK
jgi:glycosyltransferase involved in cell wall biosynthesis